jgi:hypothetical protein
LIGEAYAAPGVVDLGWMSGGRYANPSSYVIDTRGIAQPAAMDELKGTGMLGKRRHAADFADPKGEP